VLPLTGSEGFSGRFLEVLLVPGFRGMVSGSPPKKSWAKEREKSEKVPALPVHGRNWPVVWVGFPGPTVFSILHDVSFQTGPVSGQVMLPSCQRTVYRKRSPGRTPADRVNNLVTPQSVARRRNTEWKARSIGIV
jgi:hypothetical protein